MDFRSLLAFVVLLFSGAVLTTNIDGYYRLRQVSTGRYLDAYDQAYFLPQRPGFEVVLREKQYAPVRDGIDKTQLWYIIGNEWGSYSLMQFTSGRFMDSCQTSLCKQPHSGWQWDNVVMTLPANDSEYATSQRWMIHAVDANERQWNNFKARIIQSSSQMFLNAYPSETKDDQVYLTADGTHNDTIWELEHINESPVALLDGVFTIVQEATGRYLDADDTADTAVHSYTAEGDFTTRQHFLLRRVKGEVYTITHLSSGRLIGAHVSDGELNATVDPGLLETGTVQQWMMVYVKHNTFLFQHIMTGRILGAKPYNSTNGMTFACMPTLAMYDGNVTDELWTVQRVGFAPKLKGFYRIKNKATKKYLQADAAGKVSTESDFNNSSDDDQWAIAFMAGDTYEVYAHNSKRVMESASDSSIKLGEHERDNSIRVKEEAFIQSAVVPLEAANNPKEQWYLVWAGGDDWYFTQSQKLAHVRYLEDAGGVVSLATYNAQKTQIWTVELVSKRCLTQRTHCSDVYECGIVSDWCGGNITCASNASFGNGTCKSINAETGEHYSCHEDDHLCYCEPKRKCSSGACETKENDGCGGFVDCGPCPVLPTPFAPSPQASVAGSPFAAPGAPAAVPGAVAVPGAGAGPSAAPVAAPGAAISPAPAPVPFAWNLITTSTTFTTTTCLPSCAIPGWECGFQQDGCGNFLPCGDHAGACPHHPQNSTGASFSCTANHTCACVKRMKCDADAVCGFQSDGCGGQVACGNCTGGDKYKCKSNKCECVPETCNNRCGGPVPDGCGNTLQCSCTMANERCNRAKGKCERVPGPTPDPSIFASTTTVKPPAPQSRSAASAGGGANATGGANASDTADTAGPPPPGAPSPPPPGPSPVAAATTTTTTFVLPNVSPPPPGQMPTTPPPLGLHPDVVGYYTYFYYIYYYFSYLRQKSNGRTDAQAAEIAQKMAPVYAYEQLRFTFGANIIGNGQAPPAPPAGMPPLPPTGAALLEQAPAVVSTQHSSEKRLDRNAMKALLASNGIAAGNILPHVVDISMLQGLPSNRKFTTLRHQRSALRGTTWLGPDAESI